MADLRHVILRLRILRIRVVIVAAIGYHSARQVKRHGPSGIYMHLCPQDRVPDPLIGLSSDRDMIPVDPPSHDVNETAMMLPVFPDIVDFPQDPVRLDLQPEFLHSEIGKQFHASSQILLGRSKEQDIVHEKQRVMHQSDAFRFSILLFPDLA